MELNNSTATKMSNYGEITFYPPPAPNSNFPTDILRKIKANAQPLISLKLMKCCKYFCYKKFPYFVITEIHVCGKVRYKMLNKEWIEENDFLKLSETEKIWITGKFEFQNLKAGFMLPKIVANDITSLSIVTDMILFYEIKVLTRSSKKLNKIYISFDIIISKHDIFLEDLLACFSYGENITLEGKIPSIKCATTASSYISSNLKYLGLFLHRFENDVFNFDNFTQLINLSPQVRYHLFFYDIYLPKSYKKQLQKYLNKMIKIGPTEYPPVHIFFGLLPRKSQKGLKALEKAYEKYEEQKKNNLDLQFGAANHKTKITVFEKLQIPTFKVIKNRFTKFISNLSENLQ